MANDPTMVEDDDEIELVASNKDRFLHPDGDYEFVCVDVVRSISGNGNPQLEWNFRGPEELSNSLFKTWTSLLPTAAWKLTEYTEALDVGKAGEKIKLSEIKDKSRGRRVIGSLVTETRNGQKRSVIKTVKRHPDGPGEGRSALGDVPF